MSDDDQTIAEAVSEAVKQQQQNVTLKPCPCGNTPSGLLIEMQERAKYGQAMGDCCGAWIVEFRNGYTKDNELTLKRAQDAWNNAPRQEAAE